MGWQIMKKLIFGQKYIINGVMVKHRFWLTGREVTYWERSGFKSGEAIYIGYRTLYDGDISYPDEYTHAFTPTSHQQVYLFVINERRNPIYVHPEDVQS